MTAVSKRKEIEKYILKVIHLQDPSGYNENVYIDLFSNMDDKTFHNWMLSLKSDPNAKLKLLVPPFKVVLSVENAFKTAKFLGVEVLERLRLWDPVGKRYTLTPENYYVLRLSVRRLKQYLMDGLSVPDDDRRLNPLTDQVTGPSKGSALSFPEAQMIAEKGLETTLHELLSVRGGNLEAYAKMKTEIEETGDSDTRVLEESGGVKSVQTLRTLLNACHLVTNL